MNIGDEGVGGFCRRGKSVLELNICVRACVSATALVSVELCHPSTDFSYASYRFVEVSCTLPSLLLLSRCAEPRIADSCMTNPYYHQARSDTTSRISLYSLIMAVNRLS